MPQTSENPRKMKKITRVIWSYLVFKLLNPEVQFINSRSINTPSLWPRVLNLCQGNTKALLSGLVLQNQILLTQIFFQRLSASRPQKIWQLFCFEAYCIIRPFSVLLLLSKYNFFSQLFLEFSYIIFLFSTPCGQAPNHSHSFFAFTGGYNHVGLRILEKQGECRPEKHPMAPLLRFVTHKLEVSFPPALLPLEEAV